MNDPYNANFIGIQKSYDAAMDNIEAYSDVGHPADEIDAWPRLEQVEVDGQYIGDIKVSGDMDSAEDAKKRLTDEGYTVIDKNFNEGAGGCYIYLGYKTTDNYNEAIKDFRFSCGSQPFDSSTGYESKGRTITYYPIPYTGDDTFVAAKGSFIAGVDSSNARYQLDLKYDSVCHPFMYYTKDEKDDKKAVVNLYTDDSYVGHENYCPFEMNAYGSERIRVIYDRAANPGRIKINQPKGKDPEYYPYSYILGKKVAINKSIGNENFYYIGNCCTYVDGERWINLSEETMKAFVARCHGVSVKQVMRNAGIDISDPILMKANTEYETYCVSHGREESDLYRYYEVQGDMLDIDSGTIKKDVLFARMKAYDYNVSDAIESRINKRHQETTALLLY